MGREGESDSFDTSHFAEEDCRLPSPALWLLLLLSIIIASPPSPPPPPLPPSLLA